MLPLAVPYTPWLYGPLVLLHASLLLHMAVDAGTLLSSTRWGALGSAVALVAFVADTAAAVLRGRAGARAR